MEISSIRVYEGNNIKRRKRIMKVTLEGAQTREIVKYLKAYFRICFALGFREQLVSIDKNEKQYCVWISYSQEELSKFILNNIINYWNNGEKLVEKASGLVKDGLIYSAVETWRLKENSLIELGDDVYQLGYGKNSIVLSESYQSYENMIQVELSRNRATLWDLLRYAHIPKVNGKVIYSGDHLKQVENMTFPINIRSIDKSKDLKISIADKDELNRVLDNMMKMYTRVFIYSGNIDYRIICFSGEVGLIYKYYNGVYKKVELTSKKLEVLEIVDVIERLKVFCKKVYSALEIEFMYVDLMEGEKLQIVDAGNVFDNAEEMRDIQMQVIEYFITTMEQRGIGKIPIVSVTGTNGKTTTSRLAYHILTLLGYNVGLASTGGVYIGNNKIKNGDTTGFLSANEVLKDNSTEIAILETARGGLYKNGLGYDKAKVAIITSLSEDHIGMDGIKNMEDLLDIKSVVLDEVDSDGKIVVKSQKELVEKVKGRKNVCLFSIEKDEHIKKHLESNGEALYMENGNIVWYKNGKKVFNINVRDIPFTYNGISHSNVLNIMASAASAEAIYGDIDAIFNALKKLKCDLKVNPGRQNILEIKDFKVILDYGHNSEAFNQVLTIACSLNPTKITSIIAAPGDRMDKYIQELGRIAARYSDYIIIREQEDLRGRKQGESAALIEKGVLETGFSNKNIQTIFKEEEAIVYAMERAEKGEIIVLFTQCLDVVIPAMNSFLEDSGCQKVGEGLDFFH
jgi:UDP-N-acetylmuramyl tripeptide synthase